jgi:hypothetical protein
MMRDMGDTPQNLSRQEEQAELLAQAERLPGVAEVLAVYGTAKPYVYGIAAQPAVTIGNATGSNPTVIV